MLRIRKEYVNDNLSPKKPPVASCHTGETVLIQTRDC